MQSVVMKAACSSGGRGEAGRGDLFSGFFFLGAGVVEGQEVGEDVVVLAHAVGGAHGGVERGVGLPQGIGSGLLQAAVEIAQDQSSLVIVSRRCYAFVGSSLAITASRLMSAQMSPKKKWSMVRMCF